MYMPSNRHWSIIMGIVTGARLFRICILLAVLVFSGYACGADINDKIGNRINLKGTAVGADSMYLFVTGPGLPSNGVRLDTMQVPVVTGDPTSFTVTDVTNDQWDYSWNTARQGFVLKEGIYTVYAVKQPFGKSNVNNAVYGTVSVSLTNSGEPYASIGTVFFNTTPANSEIFLDGQSAGFTPQSRGVPEGVHELRLEHPGYQIVIEQLSVTPGSFTMIQRTLIPGPARTVSSSVTSGQSFTISTTAPVITIIPGTTKRAPVSVPVFIISVAGALLVFVMKGRIH